MNLADIREKAQLEKNRNDDQSRAAAAPPSIELNPGLPADLLPADVIPVDVIPVDVPAKSAEPPPSSLFPSVVAGRMPVNFDPLTVLLQGRSISGCERSALVDEMTPEEAVVEDFREFLCFRVSVELYAIDIMEIKEIIKPREITEVPRVPSFISGVLSLRGIIIPVFNMHERLGLEGTGKTGKERIIVVKKGEEFTGIVVDEVIQVVRIAEGAIEPPPAVLDGIDRDFIQGVGRFDGKMLILLNMNNILDLSLM